MFEIKNVSRETLEIVTVVDPSVKGCRVQPFPMPPRELAPGQVEVQIGYEPGVSFIVRPVTEQDRARAPF